MLDAWQIHDGKHTIMKYIVRPRVPFMSLLNMTLPQGKL